MVLGSAIAEPSLSMVVTNGSLAGVWWRLVRWWWWSFCRQASAISLCSWFCGGSLALISPLPVSPELSVVVPVFNETANLVLLYRRVTEVLEGAGLGFELVLVDDGSSDGSLAVMRDLAGQDFRVRFASFSRNFGHEAASSCGLHLACGQAVVLMDADLQDPPELIPELVARWREGNLMVMARRRRRLGEGWFKRGTSHLFYRLMNRFSEVPMPVDVGDFRLIDRCLVEVFKAMPERNRFLRGMFAWVGFPQTVVEFDRDPRHGGKTNYSPLKLMLLFLDALTGSSIAPLRLATALGLVTVIGALFAATKVLFHKLFFGLDLPGYPLLTVGVFLMGGVQLTILGIVGEYIGKIYKQVQGRPLYVVQEQGGGRKPDDSSPGGASEGGDVRR